MTFRAAIAGAVAVATVLAGCGQSTDVPSESVPVVAAEPVPLEGTGLVPSPLPALSPSADTGGAVGTEASQQPTPPQDPVGPSSADAAAFVSGGAFADINGLEHVVVDLDGDARPEVVAAGIRERSGVDRVAWWTTDGYEVMADGAAGPGRGVTDLRAADVNEDGITELLVVVEGEGLRSLSVWAVPRRGRMEPLESVGGCNDGSHVYGITLARLEGRPDAPPAIVADCDESPLPLADWSEHRWVWEDGAYRHEQHFPPGPPDHASRPDDAGPDDDDSDDGSGGGDDDDSGGGDGGGGDG